MLKIAIVEFDEEQLILMRYITEYYFSTKDIKTEMRLFDNSMDFLEAKEKYDVYIINYGMPYISGIFLAHTVHVSDSEAKIILTSEYNKYIKFGYIVGAYRFIAIPINNDELKSVLEAFYLDFVCKGKFIYVRTNAGDELIKTSEIIYIESNVRSTSFYLYRNNSVVKIDKINMGINEAYKLLSDFCFVMTHKSYCVNLKYVKSVKQDKETNTCYIQTVNDLPVIVSRERKKNLYLKLKEFAELNK